MAKWADYQRCPQCGTVLELEVERTCDHVDFDIDTDKPILEFDIGYRLVCPDWECRWKGKKTFVNDVVLVDNYEEEVMRPWQENNEP